MSKSIWELLKKNTWLEEHDREMTKMKNLPTGDMIVKVFDPSKHSTLVTDASQLQGMGYVLLQEDTHGKLKLITCGFRSLTEAESTQLISGFFRLGRWYLSIRVQVSRSKLAENSEFLGLERIF